LRGGEFGVQYRCHLSDPWRWAPSATHETLL
jgi:hypothetical protein